MPKVPSLQNLKTLQKQNKNTQISNLDKWSVDQYEETDLNKLEMRIIHLSNTELKNMIQQTLNVRRNQIKAKNDDEIEFHQQIFNQKLENRNLKIEYIKLCIMLFSIFITAEGLYSYVFQAPQFAVASGGQIKIGQVDTRLQVIGATTLILLIIVMIICAIYAFCCITEIQ